MVIAVINPIIFQGRLVKPNVWDITTPTSYQHPMAPYDVLVDPLSVPKHPTLDVADNDTSEAKPKEEDKVRTFTIKNNVLLS